MSSSSRKAYRAAIAAAVACAISQVVPAESWDFNPRLEVGGVYNDNYRMAEDGQDKVHVAGALLDAQLAMRSLTQTSEISVAPHIRTSIYPDDHDDQSTDGYLDLKGEHKTQKGDYSIIGQYANETVIYSELLPASFPGVGLGEIVGSENGRVSVHNRRELERVAPSMTYDVTPLRHLHVDLEYENISFSRNDLINQIGFHDYDAKVGMGFDMSQRSTLTVSGIGARYEPRTGFGDTNSFGAEGQWDFKRTQIQHYYFRLGVTRSQADVGPAGTVSNTSVVGGAGVSWNYQVTRFVLDGLRGVSPSSSGAVVTHDELRFRVIRALRPRLSGYVGVRGIRLRGAVGGNLQVQGTDYAAGTTGFDFQMTRDFHIAGEYDYTWQRFQGEPNAASNAVNLSFVYQPLSKYQPLPDLNGIPAGRLQ
ncbi:MAG TPA: hypothetical protein VGM84_16170 [Steroidobacteraceae bacterium]|jgi:hypothetical protein